MRVFASPGRVVRGRSRIQKVVRVLGEGHGQENLLVAPSSLQGVIEIVVYMTDDKRCGRAGPG